MMDESMIINTLGALLNQQAQNYEKQLQIIMDRLSSYNASQSEMAKEHSIPKMNITDFYGRPSEDITSWLFIVHQNLNAANIAESKRALVASSYLREAALQWYRHRTLERGEMNFQEFETEIRVMFLPHNHQELLRDKLDQLKQKGRLHDYTTSFMNIINQIQDMSEADKVHAFKRGLYPKTKAQVGYSAPKTLQAAIELAQGYDSNFFSEQYHRAYEHNNHWKREPTPYSQQNQDSMELNSSSSKISSKYHQSSKYCSYCRRKGHNLDECRSKTKPKFNSKVNHSQTKDTSLIDFIKIKAKINNVPVDCLIDTGANKSIISPSTANKCSLESLPTPVTITMADGTVVHPIGSTHETSITVGMVQSKIDLMIMPLNYDALLGLDFLSITGATIDTSKKCLIFSKKTSKPDIKLHHLALEPKENINVELHMYTEDELYLNDLWSLESTPQEFSISNPHLSKDELKDLSHIITENKGIFSTDITNLGCCTIRKHTIKTISETPIYIHPYRKSLKERTILQEEVNKMLKAGIIRESNSPWSFPVVLIKKPDDTFRFCTDYRQLNKVTPQDSFPLPRMDDIFDRLAGSRWFSKLDLKSGYWQVELDEESIPKSAFSTPDGHYEYLRLPFGIKNAPAEFSRIMFQVLGSLSFVQIYIDDITIHSHTFSEHLYHLSSVFRKLRDVNLKLNWQKCSFAQTSIHLLGHIVSEKGIAVDMKKVEAIKDMKPPQTIKDAQRFLGMTGYYRKFIEQYAEIASPLYNLLKSSSSWKWGHEENFAFETLKSKLTSTPILRLPDLQRPFIIHTDASGTALGAILSQIDQNNVEYVCQYDSRLLKGSELHYGVSEKECLGIVWAIRKFRPYLYGTKFKVITDHAALKWLMNIRDVTGRLARWAIYLQGYEFEIEHRQGIKHLNVDMLSRPIQTAHVQTGQTDLYLDKNLITFLKERKFQPHVSEEEKRRVTTLAKRFFLDGEDLYYQKKGVKMPNIKVPRVEERKRLVEQAHLLGHFQAKTMEIRLKENYYWPDMQKDVHLVINNCLPCARNKTVPIQEHTAKALPITGLFDRVGMDCVFGFPETEEGFKGILVFTEYLSKFPHAVPIKSKSSQEIAKHLFEYISFFGPPKTLLSDQGTEFLNQVIDQLSNVAGTERKVTSSYHPRTNGLTERFNRTLVESLSRHASTDPLHWHEWLPYVLLSYRTRVHSSTGFTPFELLFGKTMHHFLNWEERDEEVDGDSIFQRSIEIRSLIENKRVTATKTINKAQAHQKAIQNKTHRISTPWPRGTQVFLRNPKWTGKLGMKYTGPYTILGKTPNNNYWLANSQGSKLSTSYPLSRLKKTTLETTDQNIYEIEKILDHKIREGKIYYLVKWKDYGTEDCTWEPELHFQTLDCISDYWALKNGIVVEDDNLNAGTCYVRHSKPGVGPR